MQGSRHARVLSAHDLEAIEGVDFQRALSQIRHQPPSRLAERRPETYDVRTSVIEVRFVAKDEDDLSMFFFFLMAALGHATYV